jgi:hypothetical protein
MICGHVPQPILLPFPGVQGVNAISVGVNGASAYPDVPSVFQWRDPVSDTSILAMWHPRGYGGYAVSDAVMVPGFGHALVFDWNGDNAGPYSAADYIQHFKDIQAEFPQAQIVSSTFDNFTSLLATVADQLPTYSVEIGDKKEKKGEKKAKKDGKKNWKKRGKEKGKKSGWATTYGNTYLNWMATARVFLN